MGVAFAIDPGRSGTSYALTDEEVRPALGPGREPGGARRHGRRAWSSDVTALDGRFAAIRLR